MGLHKSNIDSGGRVNRDWTAIMELKEFIADKKTYHSEDEDIGLLEIQLDTLINEYRELIKNTPTIT